MENLNDLEWRLRIWSPIGEGPRVIHRDATTIRATGLRLQVTPEGDGKEATFNARGMGGAERPDWGLPPLSAVQFQLWNAATGDWTALYYGQVRIGGNALDVDGEGYVLRSLALRLGEVTLSRGFSTPKQPAHLTIRAIIRDALSSGQIGTPPLMEYVESLIPDLGFDANPIINGHQQTPLAFLERIQQDGLGLPVPVYVRFGVNASRQFYCLNARTDTLDVPDAALSGRVKRQAPVAEKPCTQVLWFLRKDAQGQWVTHASTSKDARTLGVYAIRQEAPADFRTATAPAATPTAPPPAALAKGVIIREAVHESYSYDNGSVFDDDYISTVDEYYETTPNAAVFNEWVDGNSSTFTNLTTAPGGSQRALVIEYDPPPAGVTWSTSAIQLSVARLYVVPKDTPIPPGTPIRNAAEWGAMASASMLDTPQGDLDAPGGVRAVALLLKVTPTPVTKKGNRNGELYISALMPKNAAPLPEPPPPPPQGTVTDDEAALLDLMALRHYKLPARDPSEIVVSGAVPPLALAGRVKHGDYERAVEALEYRLSADRGIETAFMTGQADDPLKLAQADLIKWRDQNAKIEVLLAPT